ncbi:uncharacterized protein LOC143840547 [Paroedura picta]|uniref:uncharacterized protein LOC143840547 n=1 Tax=Paroedura picta TaxID=143630 RepID=UPI004056E9CA
MDVQRLVDANENLKTEIWDLREMASDLDLEKEEIVIENQSIKEQIRSLEAKIDCFRAMAEDSRREEEELQATVSHLEETIRRLETQSQALQEINHTLKIEIQTISSHVVFFQDYQAVQEQDLTCVKQVMENIVGYFWSLKSKIEITNRHYEEERRQVCELRHTLGELEEIQQAQEDEIASLRGQLEEASLLKFETDENARAPSLLHEMVQAKLIQDSLAMQNSILFFFSKLVWLLLAAIVCVGVVRFFVKFYIFSFGEDLETGSRLLLFMDHGLELLFEVLSLHRAKKPGGLEPF